MKEKLAVTLFAVVLALGLTACGGSSASSASSEESAEASSMASVEMSSGEPSSASEEAIDSQASSSESANTSDSQTSTSAGSSQDALRYKFEEKYGKVLFSDEVRNDKTGNWRCGAYVSSAEPQDIAAEYYKAYFTDDSEIHALINLGLKTSARVSASDGVLFVTVYEYVDGEEHDAVKMFTGNVLADYMVYLDSGTVEKL